ncbi:MAG: hypothetical protein V5A62_09570 [Haloarculaceae archaeon]
MTRSSQTMAVGMALLLALSVLAPTVAAAETTVSVETDAATEVTDRSATLNGNLTELGGADNATVHFEFWVEGDRENSTNTSAMTVGTGAFSWGVSDLSNDTTYVYVTHAEANGTTVTGGQQSFTTLAEAPLGVETATASDVSFASATLNGELTGIGGEDNATVHFEYWVEGDRENASTTDAMELDSTGTFDASVSGLSNNVTYVYVAYAEANGSTVAGEEMTFTTGMDEDSDEPFGHWVSAFVHSLLDSEDSEERNLGQMVSEFVTENNPGADDRPDHAGPPEDRGNDDEEDEDGERGPPEDAGPPADRGEDDGDDENREDGEDDERGPPEDRGNDDGDDEDGEA